MELVHRARFTNMLRTLVDVTYETLVHSDITEPCRFNGWSTEYKLRNGGKLLAKVLHVSEGPQVYCIDVEWEQNHMTDFMCPPCESNIELGMDNRGWVFIAIRNTNDYPESHCIRVLAGCRNFSLEQAKEHWRDNPEVYPRILMAEQIAIHRGWVKVEPQVNAGELACEKTPTKIIVPEDETQYDAVLGVL